MVKQQKLVLLLEVTSKQKTTNKLNHNLKLDLSAGIPLSFQCPFSNSSTMKAQTTPSHQAVHWASLYSPSRQLGGYTSEVLANFYAEYT